MKKNNIFFFVLICGSTSFAWGQSMPNSVISAGGENVIAANNKIQFTIGETITLESSKTTLGFHSIFSKYLQVENHQYSNGDKVFPNPIEDFLTVNISSLNSGLTIRNINSEILLFKTLTEYNSLIDFSNFNSGIYIIEINDALKRKAYKFIKI
jgi:hypothetical protein